MSILFFLVLISACSPSSDIGKTSNLQNEGISGYIDIGDAKLFYEIKAPTLVLFGDHDMPDIIEIAELVCQKVAGAKKHIFKGAAHMLNMEEPKEFNSIVLEFLEDVLN